MPPRERGKLAKTLDPIDARNYRCRVLRQQPPKLGGEGEGLPFILRQFGPLKGAILRRNLQVLRVARFENDLLLVERGDSVGGADHERP